MHCTLDDRTNLLKSVFELCCRHSSQVKHSGLLVNLSAVATVTLISIPAFAQIPSPQFRSFTPANNGSTSNQSPQIPAGSGVTITDTLSTGATTNSTPQSFPDIPTPTTTAPTSSAVPISNGVTPAPSIRPLNSVTPFTVAPIPLATPTATNVTPLVTPIGVTQSLTPAPIPLVAPTNTNATPLVTPIGSATPTTSPPTPSVAPTNATFVPSVAPISTTTNR